VQIYAFGLQKYNINLIINNSEKVYLQKAVYKRKNVIYSAL
jgi:hypothetical protein